MKKKIKILFKNRKKEKKEYLIKTYSKKKA